MRCAGQEGARPTFGRAVVFFLRFRRSAISDNAASESQPGGTDWRQGVADAAAESVALMVEVGIFSVGGQAAVYVDGKLVADAEGVGSTGVPMRPDHLHHTFCLLKPLPFLLLAAAEQAGFGPDDPLEEMADTPDWYPDGLPVRSLGLHADGLAHPPIWLWFGTRPGDRDGLLADLAAPEKEQAAADARRERRERDAADTRSKLEGDRKRLAMVLADVELLADLQDASRRAHDEASATMVPRCPCRKDLLVGIATSEAALSALAYDSEGDSVASKFDAQAPALREKVAAILADIRKAIEGRGVPESEIASAPVARAAAPQAPRSAHCCPWLEGSSAIRVRLFQGVRQRGRCDAVFCSHTESRDAPEGHLAQTRGKAIALHNRPQRPQNVENTCYVKL